MKIVLVVAGLIVALVALILVIGALLPNRHTASRSVVIKDDRNSIYRIIRDVAAAPDWRDGVTSVELLDERHFREHSKHGKVTYVIDGEQEGRQFVTRITDVDLGYSGSWTYDLDDAPGGTRVTITERGEVSNLMFRFMSRFVFGHTATMDAYLAALQKKAGS